MKEKLMSKKYIIILSVVVFLAVIQACGFSKSNDSNESVIDPAFTFVTVTPTPTQYLVEELPEEHIKTDEPSTEQKAFSGILGLNELSAYRANLVLEWTEVISGESTEGYLELSVELTTNPNVIHASALSNEDAATRPTREKNPGCCVEMYRLSGNVYVKTSENAWLPFLEKESVDYEGDMHKLMDFPETNICSTQPEMMNGVSTIHCRFTEGNMESNVNYDSLQGDVWITVEEGYIVKYRIEAEGVNTLDEPEVRGAFTLEYNVTDINGDFSIILPRGIEQTSELNSLQENNIDINDIPVLDNAERVKAFPNAGIMTYYTPTDVSSVIDFYRQELSSSGWEQTTNLEYTDDNHIVVHFEKDGNTLGLNIGNEDGYTLVLILLNLL